MSVSGIDIGSYAQQFLGTKYVWGGNSLTSGIDCSGLVQQVYKHYGIDLPRTTYEQIGKGTPIGIKGLKPGDLVFFDTNGKQSGPDHVGIYLGDGKMIHAPRPGKSVEVVNMTSGYYMNTFMGGRRIDGTSTVGSSASDVSVEAAKKMTPEELAASYGWAYGFMNSNSTLKGLFKTAVAETWSPEKFQAELRDTKWWKETSDTRRQAQVMKSTDPATYDASIQAEQIKIQQLAAEIGAAVPSSKLKSIATNAVEGGMDESQLRYALGQYVTFTKDGTLGGEAGMHAYTMKQYAYNMGVSMSDQAIKNQAQLVVKKVATTQDFQDQIRETAKSAYPSYAQQIDAGATLRDIASPYIQTMAGELELPDNSIDVNDPLVKSALNGLDSTGKPVGLTLTDFQSQLRNDPRWRQTTSAMNSTMNTGLKVLTDMGLTSGGGSR